MLSFESLLSSLKHAKSIKTIAVGGAKFINLGVHPENMEICEVTDGKEHYYTDDGREIVCPTCGAVWLQEDEGEFSSGTCEHLRFTLHSECDDEFEFSGEWDTDNFLDSIRKAREKDEEVAILDIVEGILTPDVDKAMLHVWWDDPLYHPWMLWGFKEK